MQSSVSHFIDIRVMLAEKCFELKFALATLGISALEELFQN